MNREQGKIFVQGNLIIAICIKSLKRCSFRRWNLMKRQPLFVSFLIFYLGIPVAFRDMIIFYANIRTHKSVAIKTVCLFSNEIGWNSSYICYKLDFQCGSDKTTYVPELLLFFGNTTGAKVVHSYSCTWHGCCKLNCIISQLIRW